MDDWRKLFRKWMRRSDFVEVHPNIFKQVLDEVAKLEAENEAPREEIINLVNLLREYGTQRSRS